MPGLGKDTWKSLIAGSSLQNNCNDEGFNLKCESSHSSMRVRLGFVANNENHCNTCDSYIGFGAYLFRHSRVKPVPTCGNLAVSYTASHYDKNTRLPAFGYIFVQ